MRIHFLAAAPKAALLFLMFASPGLDAQVAAEPKTPPDFRKQLSEFCAFERDEGSVGTDRGSEDPSKEAWVARSIATHCRVTPAGFSITRSLQGGDAESRGFETLQFCLEGSNSAARIVPMEQLPGESHRLGGINPEGWVPSIARHGRIRIVEAYPGVDFEFYFRGSQMEYDVIAQSSESLRQVRIRMEGAVSARLLEDGGMEIQGALGWVRQRSPATALARDPLRAVPCGFRLLAPDVFGFECSAPVDGPICVDPQLEFGTYLGTLDHEFTYAIAADSSGSSYVAGSSNSLQFPTTPGCFKPTITAGGSVFITKLSSDGSSLVYSTYLGLGDPRAVALAPGNRVAVGGRGIYNGITSESFSTTPNAIYPIINSSVGPAFCVLNSTGSALIYGTFLSASSTYLHDLAATNEPSLFACGSALFTTTFKFPLTPGPFGTIQGIGDLFLLKFSLTSFTLQYSAAVGGSSGDDAFGLSVRGDGALGFVGATSSANFPVTPGAVQTVNNSPFHTKLVVGVLSPNATSLEWCSYWGSNHPGSSGAIGLLACSFDPTAALTVAGTTTNIDFPTTPGAWKENPPGSPVVSSDGFVSRFSPSGSSIEFSTLITNAFLVYFTDVVLDVDGSVLVTGITNQHLYPVTPGAFKLSEGGGVVDPIVTRLSCDGSVALYGSFLGGGFDSTEDARSIARDSAGAVYLTGHTNSPNFPVTPNAFDPTYNAGFSQTDAWIQKIVPPINNLPGIQAYGTGTPGCAGPHLLAAHSTPKLNNPYFALTCSNAPPSALGIAIYSTGQDLTGSDSLGIGTLSHIQFLGSPLDWSDLLSTPQGTATVKLPIPGASALAGTTVFAQAFWLWSGAHACPQLPNGISSSNGLQLVIQS